MQKISPQNKFTNRISLLSSSEIKEIYDPPVFDEEKRKYFFSLDEVELLHLQTFRSVKAKIFFVLQLGYFKYSHRFFSFCFSDCTEDWQYIVKLYFHSQNINHITKSLKNECAKNTILKQRSIILSLLSFKNFPEFENDFIDKGKEIAQIDANPKYIFRELRLYSQKYQFVFPSYSTAQKIISQIIIFEENRIFDVLDSMIDQGLESSINTLIEKEDETRYLLTIIKSPTDSFAYSDVVKEIKKKQDLEPIFNKTNSIIRALNISDSTILYFAQLINRYKIFQINQLKQSKKYLYIICFVSHHYRKINDNLIKSFLYLMGKYQSKNKEIVNDSILEMKSKQNKNMEKLPKILDLVIQDCKNVSFNTFQKQVFSILPRNQMESLTDWLVKNTFDKKKLHWIAYDKQARVISQNIRHLFTNLEFSYNSTSNFYSHFFDAIQVLKTAKNKTQLSLNKTPTDFIKAQDQRFILENDKGKDGNQKQNINSKRYETLVYKILRSKIINNDIFIKNSIEYRHVDDDLLSEKYFRENYQNIIQSLELLPYIDKPISEILATAIGKLNEASNRVNKRIIENKNPHFEMKDADKNKWSLNYDKVNHLDLHDNLFESLPQIDLVDIIHFVDNKTNIFTHFSHVVHKNNSGNIIDKEILKATITAQATNMGLKQMSSSSGFSYHKLKNMSTNFIREETLKIVNEKLVNETKKLPIFQHYNVDQKNTENIFSAIDGQKYSVGVDTINARYSQKYFGRDKGISALTMSANFQALAFKAISPNEYEGHHNLELFLMNESDIQPNYQSSDNHGVNDINFALLDFFGVQFAPRFANLNYKSQFLCGEKEIKDYPKNWVLKPSHVINQKLILEEDMNIKRVIASLALKKTTVSTIVRKISTSPKSNKTRKALAEFDKIIRSIYILNYIDDLNLRQYVQKAVNRQELYHKLRRKVGFDNGGKIMVKSETEQVEYQECNRLICNMIVYYNSYVLSEFLKQKETLGQVDQIQALQQISPIAWRHINFYGKYEFESHKNNVDFDKINEVLAGINLI